MTATAPAKHPIDFDALAKGDVISTATLEMWLQCSPTDGSKWTLGILGARETIERQRTDLVVRSEGNTIRVLLDAEADIYLEQRNAAQIRSLGNIMRRRTRIAHDNLTPEERQRADAHDRIAQATYFAARRARTKQLRVEGMAPKRQIEEGEDSD